MSNENMGLVTLLVSHFLEERKERKKRKSENNRLLLDKVYRPIFDSIKNAYGYSYEGLERSTVCKVIDIIDNNTDITDKNLMEFCQTFKDAIDDKDFRDVEVYEQFFDKDYKFFHYINAMLSKLKALDHRGRVSKPFEIGRLAKECSGKLKTMLWKVKHNIKSFIYFRLYLSYKKYRFSWNLSDSKILHWFGFYRKKKND